MGKKAKDAIKEEVKLELTPMIDVTFLILIFFMCTLKFKTLEGKLLSYLPTDRGLANNPSEKPPPIPEIKLITLRETREQKPQFRDVRIKFQETEIAVADQLIYGNDPSNTRIADRAEGVQFKGKTLEQVTAALRSELKKTYKTAYEAALADAGGGAVPEDKLPKLNLAPDQYVPHFYVVWLLNLATEEKFKNISFNGLPDREFKEMMKRLGGGS